eukprot:TRINITY_DN12154_c0_g1_i1.p1 TRINITY_DN12154_c0_g1~~TRINITY_DN12154_c0_g1_i1.p1  ORF type:complete len:877 (-),score=163.47 TRINITY_DN12154_c0_g1_i1:158-2410(-)
MAACGVSTDINTLDNRTCTAECCGNMTEALSVCNQSKLYAAFDVALTAYQLWQCPGGFSCLPEKPCFDPTGLVNGQRGALSKALRACGIPGDVQSLLNANASTFSPNSNQTCSESCCVALSTANAICNNSQEYLVLKNLVPYYQALLCDNFTCDPPTCFSTVGLLNSNIGAGNRVLRYCGAPSDIQSIINITSGEFNTNNACTQRCCTEIEYSRAYCNETPGYEIFLEAVYAYQAINCRPTFLCRPNDQCLDILGVLNPDIGALNRAFNVCGAPVSIETIQNNIMTQNNFTVSACSAECCAAFEAAVPYCNTSSAYDVFDAALTAYQLLNCENGSSCYPTGKCFDKYTIVNADRGALGRAYKTCGFVDVNTFIENFNGLSPDLNRTCNVACCAAVDNAEDDCSNETAYYAFRKLLPAYQALNCEEFTCNPPMCFDPTGFLNSRIGALNRVLRFCGAVSDVTDLKNLIFGDFNSSAACSQRCCEEIEIARAVCNESQTEFSVFLTGLYAYQAGVCKPTFLCRANDKCFDPLGFINPELGSINNALYKCGAPFNIRSIEDIAGNITELNTTLACSVSCCNAFSMAEDNCTSTTDAAALSVFRDGLEAFQATKCESNFTCNTEVLCYDFLGILNADLRPLNKAMKTCGFIGDLRNFQFNLDSVQLDPSKACLPACCDAINAAYTICNTSTLYSAFQIQLQAYQTLKCPTSCDFVAPEFSLCCELGFVASVAIVAAAGFVGLLVIVGIIVAACR